MNFCNKFLRNFVILVIFVTLTISLPIHPNKRLSANVLVVTAPGPEPKMVGTMQVTSWFCVTCKSTDNVIIEVIKNLNEVVFKTTVSLNK
jgi:hypothetical protein